MHSVEYHTRFTATGIIEPWVAHRMEKSALSLSMSSNQVYKSTNSKTNRNKNK